MQQNQICTYTSGAALAIYRRVKLVSGKLQYADADDVDWIGVVVDPVTAADLGTAVRVRPAVGEMTMIASDAITAGQSTPVYAYAAANGKVASTGTVKCGLALTSTTADGDQIKVIPVAFTGA